MYYDIFFEASFIYTVLYEKAFKVPCQMAEAHDAIRLRARRIPNKAVRKGVAKHLRKPLLEFMMILGWAVTKERIWKIKIGHNSHKCCSYSLIFGHPKFTRKSFGIITTYEMLYGIVLH